MENLKQYSAAIKSYEKILPAGNQYSRIQKIWEHPDIKNKKKLQDINLYKQFLVSEELNIQIIPAQNKVQGLTTIFAIDLHSNKEIWKKTYKGKQLTDKEIIIAMIDNPRLIERPIVTTNKKAIIGRPPENVLSLFD